MSAARIIYPPLSGRDRRHFPRELKKGEQEYARLADEGGAAYEAADRALARAHRLHCLAWSARLFIGGPDEPLPSIADALHGDVPLLQVQCRHCNHGDLVDLALVIWPREKPIHTLAPKLYCRQRLETYGRKRRPPLTGLRMRDEPGPAAPAKAQRA
jgi:hypothetical protein